MSQFCVFFFFVGATVRGEDIAIHMYTITFYPSPLPLLNLIVILNGATHRWYKRISAKTKDNVSRDVYIFSKQRIVA